MSACIFVCVYVLDKLVFFLLFVFMAVAVA